MRSDEETNTLVLVGHHSALSLLEDEIVEVDLREDVLELVLFFFLFSKRLHCFCPPPFDSIINGFSNSNQSLIKYYER